MIQKRYWSQSAVQALVRWQAAFFMLMEEAYCVQTIQIQTSSYKKYPGISSEHEEKMRYHWELHQRYPNRTTQIICLKSLKGSGNFAWIQTYIFLGLLAISDVTCYILFVACLSVEIGCFSDIFFSLCYQGWYDKSRRETRRYRRNIQKAFPHCKRLA